MEKIINNIVKVSFGTDFINEVDKTLRFLEDKGLILSIEKNNGIDCINYVIEFKDAEAAFLFGRTRPQLKII